MAAKGEQTYSAKGKTIVHFENKPFPKGDYDVELQDTGLEVRRSKEKGPDAVPYIGARFTAIGTAAKEGQKDRLVFVNFLLSLKAGKDGVVNTERGGALAEFYRAHGMELEGTVKTMKLEEPLPDGTDEATYLDPEPILEQLKEWTGTPVKAHIDIEPGKDRNGKAIPNDPGRNRIRKFLLDEAIEAGEDKPAPKNVTNLKKAAGKR